MIRLDNKINLKSVEAAHSSILKGTCIDIVLSNNIDSVAFGLVPAIIQFFATWYSETSGGKIILELRDEEELDSFYHLDYFFPIVVYCWEREIVDGQNIDLKPLLKRGNEKQYEKMKKQLAGGGNKILLSCFDHLSTEKGLLNAFYIEGDFISNEMQFDFALDHAIKNVVTLNRELRNKNYTPIHHEIVSIIYELMKNTHDWGRTDITNRPLNPNSRGLYLKLHRQPRGNYLSAFEQHEGLKDYFNQEGFQSANVMDELYFLELSVYDTGVGFVRQYTKEQERKISLNAQVDIIKHCLLRNNTSATGIEREIKGQGLDRIMRILDNKGFFWLRTANLSLFRNLRRNRYIENCRVEDVELFDWNTNSTNQYSDLASVSGSVVTLIYPLTGLKSE